VDPGDIDVVILSHVHYDHHGDPEDFEQSLFLVGPGSKGVLKYGSAGQGSHQCFDPSLLPRDRTVGKSSGPSKRQHYEQWKYNKQTKAKPYKQSSLK